ncbi:Formylglycine-generating enzyme, required for sulfatase activity, contains SUMF1/FGE domain [Alkalispirochaeta americana]|uniref:Formylglycine-generating enzyme, required for sulfatase activity, contains SUMF1/FGE domain n=1 Tax=Alkalispirochaeta americana TaxID=159291 RepID=A0A1N6PA38_9SPIO|nr:SUMF1/EgtB/PvdO family nonheme iron enzyme [Alkalispirochaeta americana]SIQ01127.1 Formylglycine-generating enzyme, required for sulfatase activity, contains SUMF1/FGE domain [Alkalispirochaeta americana]
MKNTWKNITSEEELKTVFVTLPPLFGVKPLVYVPLMWAFALVTLLFFLLLFPGLRRYGSMVTVETVPAGSSVYIDGFLQGKAPLETFLPAGKREIRTELAGFETVRKTVPISGRRLGSLVAPRRTTLTVRFAKADRGKIRTETVADFAAWSLGTGPGGQFQHPPVARDGARRLWTALSFDPPDAPGSPQGEGTPLETEHLRNLVAHARPHQIADLLGAVLRIQNPGGSFHGGSVAKAVQFFIHLDNKYQGFYRLAEDLFPEDLLRATSESSFSNAVAEWSRTREDNRSTTILATSGFLEKRPPHDIQTREAAQLTFSKVPPGPYITGYPLHQEGSSGKVIDFPDSFWIQTRLVNRRDFARFLTENPQWAPENRDDPGYLQDWPETWRDWVHTAPVRQSPPEAEKPLRFVPRPAAEAFARWVQDRAREEGQIPSHATVRLPSSEEWEYAAFLNGSQEESPAGTNSRPQREGSFESFHRSPPGVLGLVSMRGFLWQWTSDWYGNNDQTLTPSRGYHATVRGGSFANSPTLDPVVRGSQPPDWATPFLGFRLVLLEESQ